MPHERIRALRKRLAERRSKKKSKALQRRRKLRAVKQTAKQKATESRPGQAAQRAQAATERAQEEAEASREEVKLLASELGVSAAHVRDVASAANEVIDSARETAGGIDTLDADGDGDTDLLQVLDTPLPGDDAAGRQRTAGREPSDVVDVTEPVMDFGELATPKLDEFDVEDPVEDELFR